MTKDKEISDGRVSEGYVGDESSSSSSSSPRHSRRSMKERRSSKKHQSSKKRQMSSPTPDVEEVIDLSRSDHESEEPDVATPGKRKRTISEEIFDSSSVRFILPSSSINEIIANLMLPSRTKRMLLPKVVHPNGPGRHLLNSNLIVERYRRVFPYLPHHPLTLSIGRHLKSQRSFPPQSRWRIRRRWDFIMSTKVLLLILGIRRRSLLHPLPATRL